MRRPVFVDHTGRRRRAAVVLGSGLGVLLVAGLVMLTAGLVSGSPMPIPGWPDSGQAEGVVPAVTSGPETSDPPVVRRSTPATQPSTSTAPGNGNGNGNGHGRPTKTPGKP